MKSGRAAIAGLAEASFDAQARFVLEIVPSSGKLRECFRSTWGGSFEERWLPFNQWWNSPLFRALASFTSPSVNSINGLGPTQGVLYHANADLTPPSPLSWFSILYFLG